MKSIDSDTGILQSELYIENKSSEYTVSEISVALKQTVEGRFSNVRIRGEISGLKRASSGHIYFTLKDENAVLSAVCWRSLSIPFSMEEGLEVICSGKISIYQGRSTYQIIVSKVELAGIGAILAMLEKRKKKLEAEGLFSELRKKKLPYLPTTIGVITSPSGAVIKDILHRVKERFPVNVVLWGVPVQGADAAAKISAAISGFNQFVDKKPDLLIVARGGGSIEDLLPFSEEIVVRAAADSTIPIISAIGHETDFSLLDYAADLRAPTPTAAAEKAVPVREELLQGLSFMMKRVLSALTKVTVDKDLKLSKYSEGLSIGVNIFRNAELRFSKASREFKPELLYYRIKTSHAELHNLTFSVQAAITKFSQLVQNRFLLLATKLRINTVLNQKEYLQRGMEVSAEKLNYLFIAALEKMNYEIDSLDRLLESYHYKNVLDRGFAMVWRKPGELVVSSKDTSIGQGLEIEFSDGKVQAQVSSSVCKGEKLRKRSNLNVKQKDFDF